MESLTEVLFLYQLMSILASLGLQILFAILFSL